MQGEKNGFARFLMNYSLPRLQNDTGVSKLLFFNSPELMRRICTFYELFVFTLCCCQRIKKPLMSVTSVENVFQEETPGGKGGKKRSLIRS